MDLQSRHRVPWLLRRRVRALAGDGGTTQGRTGIRLLLVRRPAYFGVRGLLPPDLSTLARLWRDRRNWARARLHFSGLDTDEMVSGPTGARDGPRDHGIWRRRDDRRASSGPPHAPFRDSRIGWGLANLCRAGGDLFCVHGVWRTRLSSCRATDGRRPVGRLRSRRRSPW